MAIISLTVAKDNLHIKHNNRDLEIARKLAHAEAIILDYLKARPISIASVSATNPAVITTSVPHSLVNGATYTVAGAETTPTINGAQVVTVLSQTTFSVPVNVSAAQTSVAGTVGAPAFTDLTVPLVTEAAILMMLTHYLEHPGDDMDDDEKVWAAIGRLLMRQRDPALA